MRTATTPATADMPESVFQQMLVDLARMYGWLVYHTFDSRKSAPGFPDLVLVHARRRRLLVLEVKTNRGRVRPEQILWLGALRDSGVEVSIVRPCDLPFVKDAIGPRNLPVPDCPELAA